MKINFRQWLHSTKAKDAVILTCIILISIGIRVGITYNTLGVPIYTGEAVSLGETARNIAEGRGYVIDPVYVGEISKVQVEKNMLVDLRDVPLPKDEYFVPYIAYPPGPSVLLAFTYKVFGEYRYIYLRLLECIISSFGCLIIYLLARELFNRKIGLAAAFLYAVYLPVAYLSTWALQDALMPFFTLLAAYFFILGVRRKSWVYYALTGLLAGIGSYFQPTIMLLPFALGLGLLIYRWRELKFFKSLVHAVLMTAIMVVLVVVVICPWVVRNYRVAGDFMAMRPGMWQGIWEGFGEYENPVGAVLNDEITFQQLVEEGYNVVYGTPEYDDVLKEKSLQAIKEHPGWWLGLLARRAPHTIVYFSDPGISVIPRNPDGSISQIAEDDSAVEIISAVKSAHFGEAWNILVNHPYAAFVYGLIILFAFIPVLLSFLAIWLARRKWREIILVAMVPVYYSTVNIVFFVNWKTLVPGSLFYVLFSAIAIYWVAIKFKIIHDDMSVFKPDKVTGEAKPELTGKPVV